MSTYQHGLCMKKGHALNSSMKCSNSLKTSDEEQSEESIHWILEDEDYKWKKL